MNPISTARSHFQQKMRRPSERGLLSSVNKKIIYTNQFFNLHIVHVERTTVKPNRVKKKISRRSKQALVRTLVNCWRHVPQNEEENNDKGVEK